jgi:hypothetical protein
MEADKRGTSQEKSLSTNEKFKLSLTYMSMLEKPYKFKYLNRFIPGFEEETVYRKKVNPNKLQKG